MSSDRHYASIYTVSIVYHRLPYVVIYTCFQISVLDTVHVTSDTDIQHYTSQEPLHYSFREIDCNQILSCRSYMVFYLFSQVPVDLLLCCLSYRYMCSVFVPLDFG